MLVADDDRSLLEVLRRTLAEMGAEVVVVALSSGEEALAFLKSHRADVLVTDQKMPGMSGLDLIRRAHALLPDLQAILLTAYTDRDALLQAINEGSVYRYLVKPWQRVDLLATVRQAIAAAALRRERDALLARQERRLQTMTTLVELSTQASAPQTHRQLLERVRVALGRIVPFDVAAALLVPPGTHGPGRALMFVMVAEETPGLSQPLGSVPVTDVLANARDRCLEAYDRGTQAAPLPADALLVEVVGRGLLPAASSLATPVSELSQPITSAAAHGGDGVVGAFYVASGSARPRYGSDDEQNLTALAALTADLARRLVARMEDERRRMELMVASMADGVIMTDRTGEIFLINPSARRMLSLPPIEAGGPPVTAQFLKERLGFYPFELVAWDRPPNNPVREEVRVGEQYLHSIISPVTDAGNQRLGVVVVLRDVTEQRALQERKEEFVSIVSHELRTPLTSISGALELLVEQYHEGLTDKQLRYIQMARDSSQKLNRIVDDLLDVARAERGRLQLRTDAIDLSELVENAVERFRGAAEHRRIELSVHTRGPLRLVADGERLGQVLSNLLSNAMKFTSEGGRIELEVFDSAATHELVGFSVWNSGPPIPEADRERVFDKFEQVQASTTRRVGGTGLGLAISRGIVERHRGQIWVEPSTEGARFIVTLPTEAREPLPIDDEQSTPLAGRKAVLLVEDEPHTAWLLKGALLAARHQVYLAHDAERALAIARERRPELVSVDLGLPGASGAELVEILRHDPDTRKIPILILSGGHVDGGRSANADAVLRKPVSLAALREEVQRLLTDTQQLRRRVLVVDDDPAIRIITREVLEAHGFAVHDAEDGASALAEARRFRPDLVLMDVMMPAMDGFEAAQLLRQEREAALVPIIFVSARGQTADKVRAFKLGAEDYLVKPFDAAELVARVEKALARRDLDLGASPTTRLPGSQVIAQEVDRRLRGKEAFAFCYLDLDNLKAFNDYYGYAKADAVIRQTGDIMREALARHGGGGDFIGHIAGDDFVLITSETRADLLCNTIIEAFDRLVPLYYNGPDRDRGFIEARDRFGVMRRFPVMSISIATVIRTDEAMTHAALSERAAQLKQQAKGITGSAYVRDGIVLFPRP